jgi:dGTPase
MIDYKKKLTVDREFYPISDVAYSFESDRGRIISSPAFRRLQKRTQVFPLELDAAVRSRLTHSLEVAQTSRYIAKTIIEKLAQKDEVAKLGLEGLQEAFISTAEMTSLVHDIGNPPFGHFAEAVISDWIKQNISPIFQTFDAKIKTKLANDLENFDGNAQSVRVITKLQRLNLSFTQIASVLKYTRCASRPKPQSGTPLDYLQKKPGYYLSEAPIINDVTKALGIAKGHRFPVTYIMEAADDISYLTADLEDAVDKGLLHLEEVVRLINDECEHINKALGLKQNLLQETVKKYHERVQSDDEPYRFNMFLTLLRAKLITLLVDYVANTYIKNHEAIFHGSFNTALLESEPLSQEAVAVKVLQNISVKHIYRHKTIQNMELQSFRIVKGLLDCFKPLLEVPYEDMQKLLSGKNVTPLLVSRLYARLPKKQRIVYQSALKTIQEQKNKDDIIALERYHRVRLVLDYISGMTDDYALSEYKTLML